MKLSIKVMHAFQGVAIRAAALGLSIAGCFLFSATALAQPGASILPIAASAPNAPDVAHPSPEAVAARIRELDAQKGEPGNRALPTIVMRRTGDGKQCTFTALDDMYVNFHNDEFGCDDNIYNTFEVVGAHEGMEIDIEGSPNCDGREVYARYIVSFGPGNGPIANIPPTSVAAASGIPAGQILNDGSGKRAFIANGFRSTGESLPNAVSCVRIKRLIPNGPYRYKNKESGLCLRSDVSRPYPATCTGPADFSFYELNDFVGSIISADSVTSPTQFRYLRIDTLPDVVILSTSYLGTGTYRYDTTTSWLKTILGKCATPSTIDNHVNVHDCQYDQGTRMQWTREALPVR
ncbi:hypothetical protein [Pandoraea sp. ISTKB]|uniref:hypothetical protein n=1 Tax=Pandoraea sp. ISTKB TaxID=1586708 RepID=UPI000847439B|nr:hypothetical protein [Pandoraea sp. ISTKB]ODP30598.1 hypothetical protein A9762_09355 [Pandoraea sp. ISTKB]